MIKRKEVVKILELDTLAPGAKSRLEDCQTLDLRNVSSLAITVRCTYHPSATNVLMVHIYSGIDEIIFDTTDFHNFGIPLNGGKEVQVTDIVETQPLLLKVQLENLDTSYPVTDIDVFATLGYEE